MCEITCRIICPSKNILRGISWVFHDERKRWDLTEKPDGSVPGGWRKPEGKRGSLSGRIEYYFRG